MGEHKGDFATDVRLLRISIIAAVELTGDANAFLPLLAAAAVAYGFTVRLMRRSILTEKIARRGYHIYREYSSDPLERHYVDEVMTRAARTIDAKTTVAEVLRDYFGSTQKFRAYPVVEDKSTYRLLGIVSRHDLVKPSLSVFADERELEQFRQVWIPRSTLFAPSNKQQDTPDEHADAGH